MAVLHLKPTEATEPVVIETSASIAKEVWRLSWPAMAGNLLQTINTFVDGRFVGRLGADALAAVGISAQLTFLMFAIALAVSTGTTALVARAYGAETHDEASKASRQSLALSIMLGLGAVLIAFLIKTPFINFMQLEPNAHREAHQFLNISIFGLLPLFVLNSIAGSFRGIGDTFRPMLIMGFVIGAHILGDIAFIFGNFGFPKMGLAGAALALTLSNVIGMLLYALVFWRYGLKGGLRLELPEISWMRRILRIAVPASFRSMLYITSSSVFYWILSQTPEKTIAIAALRIGLIAEGIAFMPGLGYTIAASALVGQNLGARQPDRAERLTWAAAWQCCLVMGLMGAVFFVFAEPLARFFIQDPAVVRIAADYLRIMTLSEPFLAFAMVMQGGLQGAGDTVRPVVVTFISQWLLRIPMAYLFVVTLKGGSHAAWWVMTITTIISGLIAIYLFRQGKWKTIEV